MCTITMRLKMYLFQFKILNITEKYFKIGHFISQNILKY
jgi:hypothetical protein